MGRGVTASKFVLSIKNIVREICISSCEGFECSGNNIKLSECKRDISRHVQTYRLGINRDEISDEMDLTLCRAGK